ncbi:MAG: hypothetical protein E5Y02_10425 [Mesorhizobium sp.]|nr:MAG: hypothetical protein E5Y02_10425 [Mesorhizobium sp.]
MARFVFADADGNPLPDIEQINGDDGPEIRIVVCDPGLVIDTSVTDELRFIPAPPPPVIERVTMAAPRDDVSTVDDSAQIERHSGPSVDAQIAAFEAQLIEKGLAAPKPQVVPLANRRRLSPDELTGWPT